MEMAFRCQRPIGAGSTLFDTGESTDRYALGDLGVANIPSAITIIFEENPATELRLLAVLKLLLSAIIRLAFPCARDYRGGE
jgi:hypothetical protein